MHRSIKRDFQYLSVSTIIMLETGDANNVYIVKALIEKAKASGGFVEYVMPTIDGVQSKPKLSYAAAVPDWQWYVGAGVYLDEIDTIIAKNQQLFKDKIGEHLKIMFLVSICLLVIYALPPISSPGIYGDR